MASARQPALRKSSKAWICGLGVAALGGVLVLQAPEALAAPPTLVSTPGSDPTAAIASFTNGIQTQTVNAATYGYTFRSSTPILLKTLGIYDSSADGSGSLSQSHEIGIWDLTSGNLLQPATTISSGACALTNNSFCYVSLANPLYLEANTNYVIGASYTALSLDRLIEGQVTGGTTKTTGNYITYGSSYYNGGGGLNNPYIGTSTAPVNPAYFGPNFQYEAVPAPLPVFGAATAFGFSRRLRKRIRRSSLLG